MIDPLQMVEDELYRLRDIQTYGMKKDALEATVQLKEYEVSLRHLLKICKNLIAE